MKKQLIALVDYGGGNLESIENTLELLGYRSLVADSAEKIDEADLIVLPGVGAYRSAMLTLTRMGLSDYLVAAGANGKPILGICLGMQLLFTQSSEFGETLGLNLIPGNVIPLDHHIHIGWNQLELVTKDDLFRAQKDKYFYFNHSFYVETDESFVTCLARQDSNSKPFCVGIRNGNIVGVQFHPEKSQVNGQKFLNTLIQGLVNDK